MVTFIWTVRNWQYRGTENRGVLASAFTSAKMEDGWLKGTGFLPKVTRIFSSFLWWWPHNVANIPNTIESDRSGRRIAWWMNHRSRKLLPTEEVIPMWCGEPGMGHRIKGRKHFISPVWEHDALGWEGGRRGGACTLEVSETDRAVQLKREKDEEWLLGFDLITGIFPPRRLEV